MHAREIVFEPFDAQHQRDTGNEPVLLRARKELLEPDPKWYAAYSLPKRPFLLIPLESGSQGSVFVSQARVHSWSS